jgi:putative chitinase
MPDFSRFYAHKGNPPTQVAPESHFNDPIEHYDGRAAGESRLWGDASDDVQEHAIEAVVAASALFGLPQRETAHLLAIARVASGLNPDAADPESSRAGLAQFDDATAERHGLTGEARFDLEANAEALVRAFIEAKKLSQRRGGSAGGRELETLIYKTIHDGPEGDHGGLEISRREVMPLVDQFQATLRGGRGGESGGGRGGGAGQGPMRSGRGGGRGQAEGGGAGPMRSGSWGNAPPQQREQREQPARRRGGRRRSGRSTRGGR